MRKLFFLVLVTAGFMAGGQSTNFDLLTFKAPAGWKKEPQKDLYMLTAPQKKAGVFSIITVYKNIDGANDLSADFQTAWKGLVADRLGIKDEPAIENNDPLSGWNSQTGTGTFSSNGVTAAAILTTFSGFNKALSILVITNDAGVQKTLDQFFNSIVIRKPAQSASPATQTNTPAATSGSATTGALSDYVFKAPPGWTIEKSAAEITLHAPDKQSTLSIMPMVAGTGDLTKDMNSLFFQVFSGFEKDPYNPDHHIITKGTTPAGWNYMKEEMGIRTQVNGKTAQIYGFVFLVQLGNQDAIIAGSFAETNSLLSETVNTDWQQFFHSLSFKNYKPASVNPYTKGIIGNWLTGSYSGIVTYTFAANGHYNDGAAFSTSHEINDYQVLEKTTSFVGDGVWTLNGNTLTMTNLKTKIAQVSKIRIFDQFEFGGWTHRIGLLEPSVVDNKLFEVTLTWQDKK